MALIGVSCQLGNIPFKDCLSCSKQLCNTPYPLRAYVFSGVQDRHNMISASALSSPCLRSAYLQNKHDIYQPFQRYYQPQYGTAIHNALELHKNGEYIVESRLTWEIEPDKYISGQIDAYHKPTRTLIDYKTTSNIGTKSSVSPEHTKQANIYTWLSEKNTRVVDNIQILYLDPQRHLVLPVKKQSEEELMDWLEPAFETLYKAFNEDIAPPKKVCFLCNGYNKFKKIYCPAYKLCNKED